MVPESCAAMAEELLRPVLVVLLACCVTIWPFGRRTQAESGEEDALEELSGADYLEWGLRLAELGRIEKAAEQFRKAVANGAGTAEAHYNLGLALEDTGDSAEAESHYKKSLALDPDCVPALVNLAILLNRRGSFAEAAELLARASSIGESDSLPHFNLGCVHLAQGDYHAAVDAFRKAVQADPKDAQVRFNLAIALRQAGCHDLADNEFMDFVALAGPRYAEHRQYIERITESEADHL